MRALTTPPEQMDDLQPALAPSGRTLAFIRVNSAAPNLGSLEVLPLSAQLEPRAEPRELPTGFQDVRDPAWTADSRELLFKTAAVTLYSSLARIADMGRSPSLLFWAGSGAGQPSVAPLGHRLAYTRVVPDTNIWRVALDQKTPTPEKVIASPFAEKFPQYSPDGTRIAFASDRSGTDQIWTCLADGSQCRQVTNMTGGAAGSARWSPRSGRQLAFEFGSGMQSQIYTVSVDGGKPHPLSNATSINMFPSWSHDGKWIYFGREGENPQIWKVPSQGGAAVQVTHAWADVAVESPDGEWLYYAFAGRGGAGYDGRSGLWKMPVGGGPETNVVMEKIEDANFAVTEHGVYFTPSHLREDGSSIQFLNFATDTIQEIAKPAKSVDAGLSISPDGKSILFVQVDHAGSNLMLVEGFH